MEPIKNGLKVWLRGEDITSSSTVWKDNSGNNNNFAITGTPKSDNGFANLDGTWYASTSSLNYDYGTIEFTINFPEATNSMTFGSWESNNWKYSFGNYVIQIRSKKNPSAGLSNVNETSFSTAYGKTAVYGLTYNESSYTIFANGKIIKSGNSSDIPNITSFYLGLKADKGERGKAKVKSLRIYNRMLTHTEILNNYNYELLDMQKQSFVNESNLPKIVGKLTDSSNIKIAGNKYGNRVSTVVDKIVEKADNVTKAISQEVINDGYSFKVGTGNVDVSTDVQDGFGEVGLKGVTYQNVYPILKNSNYYSKNGNVVLDKDTIKITANGSYQNFFLKKEAINVKPNTNYTLVVEIIKNTIESTTNRIISMLHTSTNANQTTYFKTGVNIYKTNNGVHKFLVTTRENFNEVILGTRCFLGMECTSGEIWFKVSLLEGDHRNNSNLPSYFEGIVGVGDKSKNLLKTNLSSSSHNGITYTFNKDGSITANGTATGLSELILMEFDASEFENKRLCISGCPIGGGSNKYRLGIVSGSPAWVNCNDYGNGANYLIERSKSEKWSIRLTIYEGQTVNNLTFYPQLEEGSTPTPYEPYYDGHKIEILSNGKNLFDLKNSVSGYIEGNYGNIHDSDCSNRTSDFIEIEPNRSYTYITTVNVNCNNHPMSWNAVAWYDKDKKFITRSVKTGTKTGVETVIYTLHSPSDAKYVRVGSRYLEDKTALVTFSEGVISEHIPFITDKSQILLDEPLMRLPNGVADEITRDGKLIRRVGKVVLDGSDYVALDFAPSQSNTLAFVVRQGVHYNIDNEPILNNRFINADGNTYWSKDAECIMSSASNQFKIRILRSKLSSADPIGFKRWLSQNPTTVYYELETPVVTDIIPPSLRIFKGGNISFNTLVAPESSHLVQLNKSAQIERSIREVQELDNKVINLEGSYDNMILDITQQLELLELEMLLNESEEI